MQALIYILLNEKNFHILLNKEIEKNDWHKKLCL